MANLPLNISSLDQQSIKAISEAIESAGSLNQAQRELLTLMDIQMKNNFEIMIYPTNPIPTRSATSAKDIARQILHSAFDNVVMRLYVQNATFNFNRFEMETGDPTRFIKSIERATECTLTFIEDTQSTVRNWFVNWKDSIYYYDTDGTVVFRDNQSAAKKNAKILLMNGINNVAPVWISITGMIPAQISSIELGQLSEEPDYITITFDCERINLSKELY